MDEDEKPSRSILYLSYRHMIKRHKHLNEVEGVWVFTNINWRLSSIRNFEFRLNMSTSGLKVRQRSLRMNFLRVDEFSFTTRQLTIL
jgi:hypothetical protein